MKFRPPRHRADAPIVFVHPADPAWDTDKVEQSLTEHEDSCPVQRYNRGATRFDLSAQGEHGCAADFLGPGAVEYHLRRLSVLQQNEVQGMLERELSQDFPVPRSAYLQAARYGLTAVKRDGAEVYEVERPGNLSVKDVDALGTATEIGIDLLLHIGQAAYVASRPLRDDEKKP